MGRVALVRDVTDPTKLAHEQAQAQAQRHFESLLTCAPFGFAFLDRDLRFVRINEQLAEMNGISVSAHLGKTVAEIVPTLEAALLEVTARILANGQPVLNHEFTGETARAPGVTRTWNECWYPVRDEHGEITGFSTVVVDITERKQAELALQHTNACFELAVKASQVVLFQQDLELRYRWIRNAELGFDASAVVGKRDADLMERAEDAAQTEALKQEVIRSGVGKRQDILMHTQNTVHHFDLLVEPLRDAAGVITGVTCAAINITERKRAEAVQLETEQQYRALAEASAEISYRMSADWSTMLPLDGRGLLESSDSQIADWAWVDQYLPRDEHARVRQMVSDAIARKKLFEMEHRVLRADGSIGWTRSRAVPILDENENLVTWFGAASDITERKRIEEERRLLASIVENSRDFIGIADTRGNPVYGNRAAMELVGVKEQEELRGRKITDYFIAEQRQFVEEVVLPTVATDGRWAGELTMQHFVTGATIPVLYDLFRVDDLVTGQPVNFATITRDITERKRIELQLIEATAVAEKANRAKSDFLSNMSHELRTPLNSILGFAQLLQSGTPKPSPAQRQKLDYIIKGGWYLLELVSELLDLAQIESGKLTLAHEPFSLSQVMLDCQAMVEPLARERSITLTFPSAELPSYVCADCTRVKQVVINLLSNAIKYNKAHGAVTVEFALCPPDAIRVSVRDTGQGLTPEQLAQLFQPFNRLGREAGPEQGTGIGLVMSRHLVELMGGAIGAESTVGVGSVFWFELKRVL